MLVAALLTAELRLGVAPSVRGLHASPALMTGLWLAAAAGFAIAIHVRLGHVSMLEFTAGYLIEYALSVDNLFVFVVIFEHFRVPREHQSRVLFWGILTAIILRLGFIAAGALLLRRFHWFEYVLAAVLLLTAFRVMRGDEIAADPRDGRITRAFLRLFPSVPRFEGSRFLVRENGRWHATLLLLALLVIEVTDVIFALDSIPAIFAVTEDPFIVYTSNILAIAGLRSLFGVLSSLVGTLAYLRPALGAVLLFVATKLALHDLVHISAAVSLAVIGGILGGAALLSLVVRPR